MNPKAVLLAASCALLASCAANDAPMATIDGEGAARVCFVPSTINNFRSDGDAVVYVRTGRGEIFEVSGGFCRGLSSARSLALGAGPGGGRACVGDSVELAVAGPGLQGENNSLCRARIQRRLTEAEVAALAPRLRP